jgi:hypothetical protein
MLKEIREDQPEKSIKSCLSSGSPGEIRTFGYAKMRFFGNRAVGLEPVWR